VKEPTPMDKLITELTYKITHEKGVLWEERLKLYMKPKPNWMPDRVWAKIVGLVLYQTIENKW
jgi:hypothetical protein